MNHLIATSGLIVFMGLIVIAFMGGTLTLDAGCHVIGTEVNGNYTTEYLQIGNC